MLNNDCHLHGRTTRTFKSHSVENLQYASNPLTTLLLSRAAWEIRLLKSRSTSWLTYGKKRRIVLGLVSLTLRILSMQYTYIQLNIRIVNRKDFIVK